MFNVDVDDYYGRPIVIISNKHIRWTLVDIDHFLNQYQELLSAIKSDRNYGTPRYENKRVPNVSKGGCTQIYYDDGELVFRSENMVYGHSMFSELILSKEEGLELIPRIISSLLNTYELKL